ncbi:hypothetical protein ACLOJK_017281 [Asimina triloba]
MGENVRPEKKRIYLQVFCRLKVHTKMTRGQGEDPPQKITPKRRHTPKIFFCYGSLESVKFKNAKFANE